MRLLPKDSEYSWALYSVLYFSFFLIDPVAGHASPLLWFFTLLGTAVFLVLFLVSSPFQADAAFYFPDLSIEHAARTE